MHGDNMKFNEKLIMISFLFSISGIETNPWQIIILNGNLIIDSRILLKISSYSSWLSISKVFDIFNIFIGFSVVIASRNFIERYFNISFVNLSLMLFWQIKIKWNLFSLLITSILSGLTFLICGINFGF